MTKDWLLEYEREREALEDARTLERATACDGHRPRPLESFTTAELVHELSIRFPIGGDGLESGVQGG